MAKMADFDIIPASDADRWMAVLEQVDAYDFYHLPDYHILHEQMGHGSGVLIVFRNRHRVIALPLLLRQVRSVSGLETSDLMDATSVYGYAGPLVSSEAASAPAFIRQFHEALPAMMKEWRIVSAFSRLHPVLGNHRWLTGIGDVAPLGNTVAIDLSLDPEQQRALYRSNHKRNINKLRRSNAQVLHDRDLQHLTTFVDLYTETMQRVDASRQYFFSLDYFKALFDMDGPCFFHLFLCELEDEIVSGGVFSECQGIVQYHLGATATAWLPQAPMKLIFDEVRLWAHARHARWLHLGGGVGSGEDSLFRFKAGFSPVRFPFFIWKWIVQPDAYQELVQARRSEYASRGQIFPDNTFFPTYRR